MGRMVPMLADLILPHQSPTEVVGSASGLVAALAVARKLRGVRIWRWTGALGASWGL